MKSLLVIAIRVFLEIVLKICNGENVSFRQHSSFASSTSVLLQARGLCVSNYQLHWGGFIFRHPSLGLLSHRHWSTAHFKCSRNKWLSYQAEDYSPTKQFPISSLNIIKAPSWVPSISLQRVRAATIFRNCSTPHKLITQSSQFQ